MSVDSTVVTELKAHQERAVAEGLAFANGNGKPMNPSNIRRDLWVPLKKRAGGRDLDLYSPSHTFPTLGRSVG